jgi:hypothetical protein
LVAEIIIEIAAPLNRQVRFGPTGETLRGHWSHAVTGGRSVHESISQLHSVAPEIPGIYLSLDVHARVAKRYDPLRDTEEGRQLWAKIDDVLKRFPEALGQMQPWDAAVYTELDDNQVKTWLYEMRKLVDDGLARVVPGSMPMPDRERIRTLPGGRQAEFWGSKFVEEKDRYVDVRPRKGNTGTAAASGRASGQNEGNGGSSEAGGAATATD